MKQQLKQINFLRSLHNRSFALLWGGQTFSRMGDYLYQVALAWWVLKETGSATAMASVFIFSFGPTIVFTLLGGVAVDRYPRVPVMIGSDVVRGLTAVLVAILAFLGTLQLWHVYALSLIFGVVDSFFHPAYTATVPDIVEEADLSSANSLTSMSTQGGRLLGPPLGAALIAWGGPGLAFGLNGLTFFISAIFLLPLLRLEIRPSAPTQSAPSALHDLKEGIRTVIESPWLWIGIVVFALINVTIVGPYSVGLPFLVNDHLEANVGTLGILYSLFAAGYIVGGLWLGRRTNLHRRGRLLYGSLMLGGVMLLLFGLPIGIIGLAAAAFITGATLEMTNLTWTNLLQEYVPGNKLGRVSSINLLGSVSLLPIGLGLTGWAMELLGAPFIFIVGGGLTAVVALIAFRHPAIQQLN